MRGRSLAACTACSNVATAPTEFCSSRGARHNYRAQPPEAWSWHRGHRACGRPPAAYHGVGVYDWYIQKDKKVRRMSELQLRGELRKDKYTGFELVRRADQAQWSALHETSMFVEEVPMQGHPLDHARWRMVRGFGLHFLTYMAVNILVGFAAPVVLFWGIGIVMHGVKALPAGVGLWREGKVPLLPPPKEIAALPAASFAAMPATAHPRTTTAPQPVVPTAAIGPAATAATGVAPSSDPAFDPTVGVPVAPGHVADAQLRANVKHKLFGSGQPVRIAERYELGDRLGSGGMGVVFRAHDASLDRAVALKLLRADANNDTQAGTDRMLREARAMARLSHPNVVTVYDVGTYDGSVFVAMEYVDGDTLRTWLETPRSVGAVLRALVEAGEGLAAAHAAGLVHRDFKPDNVMVGKDGRVRVLDFGLAKPLDMTTTQDHLTQTGTVLGTPRYMAPEQFRGEPADALCDQFALGVVLHEALYGRHPYEPTGDLPLPRAVLAGTLRPTRRRADVPPAIHDAIVRAVSHDPAERFDGVAQLLAAFGPLPTSDDEIASLTAAIRRLLAKRGNPDDRPIVDALAGIERTVAELDARAESLGAQVDAATEDQLQGELADAVAQRETATDPATRKLREQQVQSLQSRLDGIARARETVDHLRTRRRIAQTQLAQLHLDLTRAEAADAPLPDLTGPLQELRFHVDAAEEVEALLR